MTKPLKEQAPLRFSLVLIPWQGCEDHRHRVWSIRQGLNTGEDLIDMLFWSSFCSCAEAECLREVLMPCFAHLTYCSMMLE